MAPTYTNMDHQAVFTLIQQQHQQQIDLTPSISTLDIQFVDEFQYDEQINNKDQDQQQHGISGTAPGYHMGRQSVTDAVTIPPIQC